MVVVIISSSIWRKLQLSCESWELGSGVGLQVCCLLFLVSISTFAIVQLSINKLDTKWSAILCVCWCYRNHSAVNWECTFCFSVAQAPYAHKLFWEHHYQNITYCIFCSTSLDTYRDTIRDGVLLSLSPVNKHILQVTGHFVSDLLPSLCILTFSTSG